MKKTSILSMLIGREFFREKNRYLFFVLIFTGGIVLGTIACVFSDSEEQIKNYVTTFLSSYSLHGTVKSRVLFLSLLNYGKFVFFLWASGWYLWLFPLCFLQVFVKGFRIGFAITSFVQCLSFRGMLFSILTLLPQNLIFLPALFYFSVYQFQFLSDRKLLLTGKNNSNFKKQCYQKNIFLFFLFVVIIILCALIESYFIPTLLQPFSKLLG